MVNFEGGIGLMNQGQIIGLARALIDGNPKQCSFIVKFQTLGSYPATKLKAHAEGWVNFCFIFAEQFQNLSWTEFLEEFVAVYAVCQTDTGAESWPVPLHKNALNAVNRTTLSAERLKDYRIAPKPDGRIAAFTIVYNEYEMLPRWISYYGRHFGEENLYVIDQGSERPYGNIPEKVNVVRLPRDEFDNWLIARIVAFFQRFLLESYDSVVYVDSDEFICASPDTLDGRTLARFLLDLRVPIARARGYNLHHDILNEPAYDSARPILSQRRIIMRASDFDKPAISRVPLNWIPGFHQAKEGGVEAPGLFLLHLRYFDLDAALVKGGYYRASKWNPYDIPKGLSAHQLKEESHIVSEFNDWSRTFAHLTDKSFEYDAEISVVPAWMREAVFV